MPQVRQAVLSKTEVDVLLREATLLNHRFYDVWVMFPVNFGHEYYAASNIFS